MKIKIAIIEDEKNNVLLLESLLQEVLFEYEVVGNAPSVNDGVELIKSTQPDLVFQDIKIKGGTGFQVLEAFPNRNFEVIFITAYSEFAIKAIKTSAMNYLLKPVDTEEFIDAVHKAYNTIVLKS